MHKVGLFVDGGYLDKVLDPMRHGRRVDYHLLLINIVGKAALARWSKEILEAICGSPDRPLKVGDIEIPCYVLEDGTRVITGRGMTNAIGMKGRGQGVVRITQHKALKLYLGKDLAVAIANPIKFRVGGLVSYGYEATILQKLCDAILTAKDAGALKTEQELRYNRSKDFPVRQAEWDGFNMNDIVEKILVRSAPKVFIPDEVSREAYEIQSDLELRKVADGMRSVLQRGFKTKRWDRPSYGKYRAKIPTEQGTLPALK